MVVAIGIAPRVCTGGEDALVGGDDPESRKCVHVGVGCHFGVDCEIYFWHQAGWNLAFSILEIPAGTQNLLALDGEVSAASIFDEHGITGLHSVRVATTT
jgi:hypothetical protein